MSGLEAPLGTTMRPARNRTAIAGSVIRRPAPSARAIARRRFFVWLTKWSLPIFALVLLAAVALWPEIVKVKDKSRVAFRRALQLEPESGEMRGPRYNGVDERGRPYTVTATIARQTSPNRIVLTDPKGDAVTEAGTWLMVTAQEGVFLQHEQLLDLAKDVVLYREDGTRIESDTAAIDLRQGAAANNDKTHAEGPFGILDSQGFTLIERGSVIQFQGPAHLVLNAAEKQ